MRDHFLLVKRTDNVRNNSYLKPAEAIARASELIEKNNGGEYVVYRAIKVVRTPKQPVGVEEMEPQTGDAPTDVAGAM